MTKQPTPQREVFTVRCNRSANTEDAASHHQVIEFASLRDALANARAFARGHNCSAEVWIDYDVIVWDSEHATEDGWLIHPTWDSPRTPGHYELHYTSDSDWTPIYRRKTPTSRNTA